MWGVLHMLGEIERDPALDGGSGILFCAVAGKVFSCLFLHDIDKGGIVKYSRRDIVDVVHRPLRFFRGGVGSGECPPL